MRGSLFLIPTWTVATNNIKSPFPEANPRGEANKSFYILPPASKQEKVTSKLETTLNKLINEQQRSSNSSSSSRQARSWKGKMSGKRKSASLAFYCFWHCWSGTARMLTCSVRFCPTQKCHIQFRRHSIGSLLTLRVERLLLFGSYFCGSGRSCGQNTELQTATF